MPKDYGLAKISNGTHYEEHVGEMVSLVFGERLSYVGSNQNDVVAAIDSVFQLAKTNQTGIDTQTTLQQVDAIRYVKGMAIDVAQIAGGSYEQSFAVTAGSTDSSVFSDLYTNINDNVFAKAAKIATSLADVRSVIPNSVGDLHLEKEGELGADKAIGYGTDLASIVDQITKTILPKIISTYQQMNPYSALTINDQSTAFMGTQGGNGKNGSVGLLLSPSGFTLSADASNRAFTKTESLVTGFNGDAAVSMQATTSDATLAIIASVINMTTAKSSSEKSTSSHTASQYSVETINGQSKTSVNMSSSNMTLEAAQSSGSGSITLQSSQVKGAVGSNTSLILSDSSGTLEYKSTSSKVVISSSSAKLSFGSCNVTVDAGGVAINGSNLKVLM
jgi:hypothetical protein